MTENASTRFEEFAGTNMSSLITVRWLDETHITVIAWDASLTRAMTADLPASR